MRTRYINVWYSTEIRILCTYVYFDKLQQKYEMSKWSDFMVTSALLIEKWENELTVLRNITYQILHEHIEVKEV